IASLYLIRFFLKENNGKSMILSYFLFALSLLTKGIALLSPFFFVILFIFSKVKLRKYLFLVPFFITSLVLGILTQKGTEDISQTHKSPVTIFVEEKFGLESREKNPESGNVVNEDYANFVFSSKNKKSNINFDRKMIFSQAIFHYPLKLIAPFDLHFIYKSKNISFPAALFFLSLMVSFFIYSFNKSKDKNFLFTFFYFVIFLTPYLGVTFITFFYWSNVSDRYTYYLIPAYVFLIGLFLKKWEYKSSIKLLISYSMLLLFFNMSYGNRFNDLLSLYTDTLEQKNHPAIYSLIFEQYLYKLDLPNSEAILGEGIKHYPNDSRLKEDLKRLESLQFFYKKDNY
ncbi:MAG: hypothetical protein K2Q18_12375, partial [Bdellovibrionales bacterium]|nr:hypothetical protein [Bdellovibrionales bacterium]